MSILVPILASLHIAAVLAGSGHDWSYDPEVGRLSPDQWHEHYPNCGGKRQSPIDVIYGAIKSDSTLKPLRFNGYDVPLVGLTAENDGHTLKVSIDQAKYNLNVTSGGLPAPYRLTQFHFHWPSEHTINGYEYPLELHLVHANTEVPSDQVTTHPNGLIVVAIFFDYDQSSRTVPALSTILKYLPNYDEEGEKLNLTVGLKLSDFLPAEHSYIRYSGSLTTPGCNEVVEFHLMTNTRPINEFDVYRFTKLKHEAASGGEEAIAHNDRPPQKLNGRTLRLHGNLGDF